MGLHRVLCNLASESSSPYLQSEDSTRHEWCKVAVFSIEKHPRISGPSQFKSVLFKGQLYCRVVRGTKDHWLGAWGLKPWMSDGVIHRAREDVG